MGRNYWDSYVDLELCDEDVEGTKADDVYNEEAPYSW